MTLGDSLRALQQLQQEMRDKDYYLEPAYELVERIRAWADALDPIREALAQQEAQQFDHDFDCIGCGESKDGGWQVENGPGPFCSQCWEKLQVHFGALASSAARGAEPEKD